MKILYFLTTILILNSCRSKDDPQPPVRAKGLPREAFWVGGVDGGNWYWVRNIHAQRNTAIIQVYSDQDGRLIVSKKFSLICPPDNPTLISNLPDHINGFDGEKIYLKSDNDKNSCYLE